MNKRSKDFTDVVVEIVPIGQMQPNPRNPFLTLTCEERYARMIQILAETYRRMKNEEQNGPSSGSPNSPDDRNQTFRAIW